MWAWLNDAYFAGTDSVNGTECNVWNFTSVKANLSLCAVGDMPLRYFTQTYGALPGANVSAQSTTAIFKNVTVGPPSSSDIEVPKTCYGKPMVCDEDPGGRYLSKDFFIAHPEDKFNISNQDLADVLGDTIFTCVDVIRNNTQKDEYSLISHYRISLDTRYGIYALCNGYPGQCIERDLFHVGREAAFGFKDLAGQCANNSDIGNWYSMPSAGRCESRAQLMDGTCTWLIEERVKTINLTCPFEERGMLKACYEYDPKKPVFDAARIIFENSFASEDPAKGGCKDLGGPTF
ncbi:hypothetical protein AAMO2058_000423500 [Amorphochlora amoebiformis]